MFTKFLRRRRKRGPSEARTEENESAVLATAQDSSDSETVKQSRLSKLIVEHVPLTRRSRSPLAVARQIGPPIEAGDRVVEAPPSEDQGSRDPLGLRVVYSPPGSRKADIIFVHGLGGGSRRTWCYNHDPDFFWPVKFLSREPSINQARILSYGYNADYQRRSTTHNMTVLDFAKDLLFDLKHAQDDSLEDSEDLGMGECPIIFVVHSMGGLVVKQAYLQGRLDPAYEPIIQAVSSIVFLSTPHRGSNLAETLNRILQASFVLSPKLFIDELAAGSKTLENINDSFRHVALDLQLVSFYETRETLIWKKAKVTVLEKDSSTLGYPRELSKPLDADHHGVCKFSRSDDPGYIAVRNAIKTLMKTAMGEPSNSNKPISSVAITSGSTTEVAARTGSDANDSNLPCPEIRLYLAMTDPHRPDFTFFHSRWAPGTCKWILTDDSFLKWRDAESRKAHLLWVAGHPASGKSILSAFVIQHLIERKLPCCFFFIRFTSQEKRSVNFLLRALAYQLATLIPAYAHQLRKLAIPGTDLKTAEQQYLWQWLFKQTFFRLELSDPVYIVIDGVDEADQPSLIVELLSELSLADFPCRIMMVGRKTHEISSAITKALEEVQCDVVETGQNQDDFRSYIRSRMNLSGDEAYEEQVTCQLLDRAAGNFLWLHLALEKIHTCYTKMDVEAALQHLPSGMEAFYGRMAHCIQSQPNSNDRKLGLNILAWIACAKRPLTIAELSDALAGEVLNIKRTVSDLCGGLITVGQDGKVALIHETAREYVTGFIGMEEKAPLIDPKATHAMLFRRCIARLTDPTLRNRMNRGLPPALLNFATTEWTHHLAHAGIQSPKTLSTAVGFLQGPHVLTWIRTLAQAQELQSLLAASQVLRNIGIAVRGTNDEQQADCNSSPQAAAAAVLEGWATDLVKIVGKFGNNLRRRPDSVYRLIPPLCPKGSSIYRQFGDKEQRFLRVTGRPSEGLWDDCLARVSLTQRASPRAILAAGSRFAVLAMAGKVGTVTLFNSVTFEQERCITHPEYVWNMSSSRLGDLIITYGRTGIKIWKAATGDCVQSIQHSPGWLPPVQSIHFNEKENTILTCSQDKRIRRLSLEYGAPKEWEVICSIVEEYLEGAFASGSECSALSPDGTMVALGYRNYPLTVWQLDPLIRLGRCYMRLYETDKTIERHTYGEVFQVEWHPFNGEIIARTQVGQLFRWDPFEEDPGAMVNADASGFSMSWDGSLVVAHDPYGRLKVYSTADFSLLYQVAASSLDPRHLAFSADVKRLYEVYDSHINIWEPRELLRLADSSDKESQSQAALDMRLQGLESPTAECPDVMVDSVVHAAGQPTGPLYSYATNERNLVILGEAGRGNVCVLDRLVCPMIVHCLTWDPSGTLLAYVNLSGQLSVKKVGKSTGNCDEWKVTNVYDFVIPRASLPCYDIVFHATKQKLFVFSVHSFIIDLESKIHTQAPRDIPALSKWEIHPSIPDALLNFTESQVQLFSWNSLEQIGTYPFAPTGLPPERPRRLPLSLQLHRRSILLLSSESPQAVLWLGIDQILFLDLRSIASEQPTEAEIDAEPRPIPCMELPTSIVSCVRRLYHILPGNKLAFLDKENWVCTWKLPKFPPTPPSQLPQEQADTEIPGPAKAALETVEEPEIERHYFLPGDWAIGNEAHVSTMTRDGKLLIPKNGDIIVVQAAKLGKEVFRLV